jgi:alkylhydroperoxidase family enzyme
MARIGLEHDRSWFVRAVEWGSRRKFRKVPDPVKVALHNRPVLISTMLLEGSVTRWKSLDPGLKALAVMVTSAQIGCSWCMDFGYWEYHHQGVAPAKLRDVPVWRDSDAYTDLERAVMEYTEAMTATPPEVTDEQVERLRQDLTDEQLVELTALVSLENFRSRVNAAVGLTSQGFKEYCELRPVQ